MFNNDNVTSGTRLCVTSAGVATSHTLTIEELHCTPSWKPWHVSVFMTTAVRTSSRTCTVMSHLLDHEIADVIQREGVLLLTTDAILGAALVQLGVVNGLPERPDVVVHWALEKAVKTQLKRPEACKKPFKNGR